MTAPLRTPVPLRADSKRQLDELTEQIRSAGRLYLRARGWDYSCNWPGCYCLWSKTLPDGRLVACGEKSALAIEENFDPPEPDDEPT